VRSTLGVLLFLAALPTAAQKPRAVRPPSAVPAQYQQLYGYLDAVITGLERYLDTRTVPADHVPLFGAELAPANGNRGADLLRPDTLAGVRVYLDALQRLGVNHANVSIVYPLFEPDFPRRNEYIAFYRAVAQEVRRRNMKLGVGATVIFAGTPFANTNVDFSDLTLAQYREGKRNMVRIIISELAPDFLGLGSEPDTEAALTGLEELNSPAAFRSYIEYVLEGLDRGDTLIGAGIGTWGNLAFVNEYVKTSLDFIDLHIYPIWPYALQNAVFAADIARRNGKRVTIDETWLYKALQTESTNIAANEEIFRRDAFSFWSPLDRRFLAALVKLARVERAEYISPFWSVYFFGAVEYDSTTAALPYADIAARANRKAVENILAGRTTPLGEEYRRLTSTNHVSPARR
jgi:hypothetical protein